MIHIIKGFGIVNKTEIDVFLELPCFFHDPADVGWFDLWFLCLQSHQWASLSVERARVPGFGDWWKSVSYSGGFSQLGENKNKYGEYLFVLKEIKVDRRRRGGGEGG